MSHTDESYLVPVCAATSFLKSPIVSDGFALIRTFFPNRSFTITSIIALTAMSHSFGKSRMDDVIANIGMSHSSFGSNGQGGGAELFI
jgi:catalase (peroxidase I)